MAINIYVNFNGDCREAINLYAKAFNCEEPQIMTYGEAPEDPNNPLPEEAKNLIMHGRLTISGSNVMFSDVYPGSPHVVGNNLSLTVVSQDMDEIKHAFNHLKEGGTVGLELQETFWSKCYGYVTDKFGIHWQLNFDSGEENQ